MSHIIRVFNFKRDAATRRQNINNHNLRSDSGYPYTHIIQSGDQDHDGESCSIDVTESGTLQNQYRHHRQYGMPLALARFERLLWLAVTVLLSIALTWRILADRDHINRNCQHDHDPHDAISQCQLSSSYETGFSTDLGIATEHISLKPVQYTSGIERDQDGNLFLNLTGVRKVYVGEPSPEIEANWEELEGAVELVVTRQETATKDGRLVHTMSEPGKDGTDGYRISIDVIHSLHCVNQLRKAVYSDHYFPGKPTAWYFTHMNHCVDHLRQAIECHSDLTPLAYDFDEEKKQGSPIWTNPHMCRDFDKILAWDLTRVGPVII